MMIQLVILIISALINLVLGLFVYYKNPKSVTNRLFFALTFTLAAWSVVSHISLHPILFGQIYWVRIVLFTAAFLNLLVLLTFDVFPRSHFAKHKHWRKRAVLFTLFVAALTQTPLVFDHLEFKNGVAEPVPAPGIGLFALQTALFLVAGIYLLVKKYQSAKALERQQLKYLVLGIVLTFGLIFFTNFVLAAFLQITELIALGPAYTLIFSGLTGYAIVRQRLFDIRAVVARAIAYVLSLVTLAFIYGGVVFAASTFLFGRQPEQTLSVTVLYTVLAVIMAFTFQPIKVFFDKLTDKIFFQDRYDTHEVLNKLSSMLAAEIDIDVTTKGALKILTKPIRAQHGTIVVMDSNIIYKTHGMGRGHPTELIEEDLETMDIKGIVVTDEISDLDRKDKLNKYDIALAAELKTQDGVVGYLLFGPDKSGSIFSDQDVNLVDIASKELAVAVENARSYEKVQAFNITLQKEIKAATAELRIKNRKLHELDKAKDDFISMASHQLRTPLTTVKGYISMMLDGDTGKLSQRQKSVLDLAYYGADRMVFLITDLLNVSRMSTGKFVIERTPVNLLDVVKSESGQLQRTAEGHKVELVTSVPDEFPTVELDENKTRQVMMNFIDNAIYYTPAGGTVTVELENTGDAIEFRVVDTGIGVPEEDKAKLFTKFYRADNAKEQRPDGTGLGLFMAKKVITAQGGSIVFRSRAGHGSTFGFRFPLAVVGMNGEKKEQTKTPES